MSRSPQQLPLPVAPLAAGWVPLILLATGAVLAGCAAGGDGGETETQFEATVEDPELEAALGQAVLWSANADMSPAWAGLGNVSRLGGGGCPASYSGEPPDVDIAGTGAVGAGSSWVGSCDIGSTSYRGYMYWESSFSGDVATGAARMLAGDSSVLEGDTNLYEFDGSAVDRYEESTLSDGRHIWEYQSTVTATTSGSLAFGGSNTPGGVQQDASVYYSGGDIESFEAIGNYYLLEDTIGGRFDSVYLDVELQGVTGADADDCTLEPKGTIGLRDTDAHWYYVVFEPKYNSTLDYSNDEYSNCDGCGTSYYRGFEQEARLCPDFGALWSVLAPPASTEFSL